MFGHKWAVYTNLFLPAKLRDRHTRWDRTYEAEDERRAEQYRLLRVAWLLYHQLTAAARRCHLYAPVCLEAGLLEPFPAEKQATGSQWFPDTEILGDALTVRKQQQ